MAGIYLHIPFCKQACAYCNFHFTTSTRYKDDLVRSMLAEIELEKNYLEDSGVETIYFGGGTPSILTDRETAILLEAVYKNFNVSNDAEVTLEANPDDISKEKLQTWKDLGINRLSIGVQSFFEDELKWMNRAHNARQARQCIEWSLTKDFNNFSIDLIYGSPLLSDKMWEQNVDIALSYEIPHLSCYALTIEEKTPLFKQISTARKQDVDPDKQARQFLLLMQWLRHAGYEHYEVSNFAKPGNRSRHNSSYWKGLPYLGLGPSAHSYKNNERRWNIPNNMVYMKGVSEGQPEREKEILSDNDRLNEFIMISLRTIEGMDILKLESGWGSEQKNRILYLLEPYLKNGLVRKNEHIVQLTDEGMLRADGIASALFQV